MPRSLLPKSHAYLRTDQIKNMGASQQDQIPQRTDEFQREWSRRIIAQYLQVWETINDNLKSSVSVALLGHIDHRRQYHPTVRIL